MTKIPDDIMLAAEAAFERAARGEMSAQDSIARAILAERKRCADVARAYLEDLAGCDLRDDEPGLIAKAIEAGT